MTTAREPKPAVSDELRAEMQAKAKAAVATWPPLTADQLAELRRVLSPEFAQNSPITREGRN